MTPTFRIGDTLWLQPSGVDNLDTYGDDFKHTEVKIVGIWFCDPGYGAQPTDRGGLDCVFDVEDANGRRYSDLEINPAGRFKGPLLRMSGP